MEPQICLVFNAQHDRDEWLPEIRRWVSSNDAALDKLGVRAKVVPWPSLSHSSLCDALRWRAESPRERLVVAFGFRLGDIESLQDSDSSGEPIIVDNGYARCSEGAKNVPSASFLDGRSWVAPTDLTQQLRKSLIRVALRTKMAIRPPDSDGELSQYFALRYQVWKEVGYLRTENRKSRIEWEVDHCDRTAIPLVAIMEGRVVACTRLISSYGAEEQPYCSRIDNLLRQVNDAVLCELFEFPPCVVHPFDVLQEFPEFRAHYRRLLRRGLKAAEVGRVIVHPDFRGQFLAEVLVDTAVSFAQQERVASTFLACREQLEPLYSRCGFRRIPGLLSEKFFNISLPSILMERRLREDVNVDWTQSAA
jgi:predicted GNAT family N-acyltransferase